MCVLDSSNLLAGIDDKLIRVCGAEVLLEIIERCQYEVIAMFTAETSI